ncbi:MAG: FkbM family methyltransferase [Xanthobacteraceae bacterium]
MRQNELIGILYRGILGREPDPEGLAHHCNLLAQGESLEAIAASMHASPEADRRRRQKSSPRNINGGNDLIIAQLREKLVILDVGAQNLEGESHVYAPLIERGVVERIIGFEPLADKAGIRNSTEPLADIRPIALGTGHGETLHINNYDATSSVFPINEDIMHTTYGLDQYKTVRQIPIKTVRLDDVDTPHRIDLMKLDVQGYELAILENSIATLEKTLFVQCEVEFHDIYKGQPLFGDVFNFLNSKGFALCDIINQVRLSSRKSVDAFARSCGSTLYWGDAVFMKKSVSRSCDLINQALIASCVYGWYDVCYDLLSKYDLITGEGISERYIRSHGG